MKIVGFIRVSTEEQAREGVSLDNQEQKIRGYCALYGHELLEIICESGISAGKSVAQREGLKRIIEMTDKRNCKVEGILVYSLSRIFRNAREALEYTERWDKKGIALISVQEQLDTKSAMGKFFFTIISATAEMEKNVISERTADVLQTKRKNGEKTGGKYPPYGYDTVIEEDVKKLIPNQDEQEVISLMIQLRGQGKSLRAIGSELEKRGIPTKRGGLRWSAKTVATILERGEQNRKV